MKSKVILDNITVDTILEKGRCSHIDRDMVMLEHIDDMPKSNQPRRMGCLFLAICLRGSASYTVDTVRYDVKANDLIIISEGKLSAITPSVVIVWVWHSCFLTSFLMT